MAIPMVPYPAGLTTEDIQVLQALADGLTIKQVSVQLSKDYTATKCLIYRIHNKVGMDTTVATIAWCFRNKVLV